MITENKTVNRKMKIRDIIDGNIDHAHEIGVSFLDIIDD